MGVIVGGLPETIWAKKGRNTGEVFEKSWGSRVVWRRFHVWAAGFMMRDRSDKNFVPRAVYRCSMLPSLDAKTEIPVYKESRMPRWLFVALVVLSAGSDALAQMADQEVMKAEQARAEARRKGDSATLTRLMSDDFLVVGPAGQVQDRKYVASLAAAPKFDVREIKTQVFGDVAVVTGIQSGVGPNAPDARFTRVWQRRGGQWVNAFGQITPIAAAQPPANPQPAATSAPPPTKWPEGKTQDEREVLKTQRMLNELYARKDSTAYERLTADTFLRINANGTTVSKGDFLKTVAGTPDVKRVESNNADFHLRSYGPIAVVAYIDRAMGAPPSGFRMTRVYVKQDGAWKQLVTQFTRIAQQ